jgi:hypothetical protein
MVIALLLIFTDHVQMGIVCPVARTAVSAQFLMKQAIFSRIIAAKSLGVTGL